MGTRNGDSHDCLVRVGIENEIYCVINRDRSHFHFPRPHFPFSIFAGERNCRTPRPHRGVRPPFLNGKRFT